MSTKLKNSTFLKKALLHTLIMSVIIGSLILFLPLIKNNYEAEGSNELKSEVNGEDSEERFLFFHDNTIYSQSTLEINNKVSAIITEDKEDNQTTEFKVLETINTTITGYSSTVDQTNCQPFITASGAWVRDGIVAANFLPFGTQIRIPRFFGDKVFVVKDRMNRRHNDRVDIWFSTRQQALNFGIQNTYIEIVEEI